MKVVLHFKQRGMKYPIPTLNIEITGLPEQVDDIVEAVRERAKNWEDWEEY